MKNVLFFTLLFCTISVPVLGELTQADLEKLRVVINDEIKKEISNSETRMKEYIAKEISNSETLMKKSIAQERNTVNVKISEMDKRLNMLFGVVIALVVIVGIPQIVVALRSAKYNELEKKIEHLTEEIQTLKQ